MSSNRKVAAYLREHWDAPVQELPEDADEQLRRLVVGLAAIAPTTARLSRAGLQSQLARVELAAHQPPDLGRQDRPHPAASPISSPAATPDRRAPQHPSSASAMEEAAPAG